MEKLKKLIVGLVLVNCLGIAVFAGCASSVTFQGMTCTSDNSEPEGSGGYCNYSCPDGTFISMKHKGHDMEAFLGPLEN